jgi:CRP-like cAMP-binding protein
MAMTQGPLSSQEAPKVNVQALLARLVSATQIFKGLATADVELLIAASRKVKLLEGDDVFLEGDPAKEMFVLLSGELLVWSAASGKGSPLATMRAGAHFGEMALLRAKSLRTTNVSVSKEGLAIAFSPLRLHDAPAAEAMVYRNVARQLADRLESLEQA